jgi:hypothetical protein
MIGDESLERALKVMTRGMSSSANAFLYSAGTPGRTPRRSNEASSTRPSAAAPSTPIASSTTLFPEPFAPMKTFKRPSWISASTTDLKPLIVMLLSIRAPVSGPYPMPVGRIRPVNVARPGPEACRPEQSTQAGRCVNLVTTLHHRTTLPGHVRRAGNFSGATAHQGDWTMTSSTYAPSKTLLGLDVKRKRMRSVELPDSVRLTERAAHPRLPE